MLSLWLSACKAFESMNPADIGRLVERIEGCKRCTSWMHHTNDCAFNSPTSCRIRTAGWYLGMNHQKTLHWAGTELTTTPAGSSRVKSNLKEA